MGAIFECEHLVKRYGDVVAVNDVSLSIEEGEIFGLVGPNGAGKTTLIEMLESLRTPDSGSIRILGLDPTKEADEFKEKIDRRSAPDNFYPAQYQGQGGHEALCQSIQAASLQS